MKEDMRAKVGCKNKECQTVTCIHCMGNTCMADECQYYERYYKQEH